MPIPKHIDLAIKQNLGEIHGMLRPGVKLLLVVDAGCADESFTIGDADSETAIQRIRELDALAAQARALSREGRGE
jgi:hypothetical protein